MKNITLATLGIIMLLLFPNAYSINKDSIRVNRQTIPEKSKGTPPYFMGKPAKKSYISQYIKENIQYPEGISEKEINGCVHVKFTITQNGILDKMEIVEGLHPFIDKEVLSVLSTMKDWEPGIRNGKTYNATTIVGIPFGSKNICPAVKPEKKPKVKRIDQMPQFKGGIEGLFDYIKRSLKYPKDAAKDQIGGKVKVGFVVDRDGKIKQAKVVQSVHPLLDREALRVVRSMPKWTPGIYEGKPVPVYYTIPINFNL